MIRYNNILCVSYSELVPSLVSFHAFRKAIERGKINRVRRASFETPALIEVASLPEKILAKLREKYGENFDRAAETDSLEGYYSLSQEALDFYRSWKTTDGQRLSEKLIEEYTTNASVLIALRKYYNYRFTYIKSRGGSVSGLWRNVSAIINCLPIDTTLDISLPPSLDTGHINKDCSSFLCQLYRFYLVQPLTYT